MTVLPAGALASRDCPDLPVEWVLAPLPDCRNSPTEPFRCRASRNPGKLRQWPRLRGVSPGWESWPMKRAILQTVFLLALAGRRQPALAQQTAYPLTGLSSDAGPSAEPPEAGGSEAVSIRPYTISSIPQAQAQSEPPPQCAPPSRPSLQRVRPPGRPSRGPCRNCRSHDRGRLRNVRPSLDRRPLCHHPGPHSLPCQRQRRRRPLCGVQPPRLPFQFQNRPIPFRPGSRMSGGHPRSRPARRRKTAGLRAGRWQVPTRGRQLRPAGSSLCLPRIKTRQRSRARPSRSSRCLCRPTCRKRARTEGLRVENSLPQSRSSNLHRLLFPSRRPRPWSRSSWVPGLSRPNLGSMARPSISSGRLDRIRSLYWPRPV